MSESTATPPAETAPVVAEFVPETPAPVTTDPVIVEATPTDTTVKGPTRDVLAWLHDRIAEIERTVGIKPAEPLK